MAGNPYVFVVGCPRSGTTLLQRMLDAHPLVTVANDTHFITRAPAPGNSVPEGDPPLSEELVERVRTYHRFPRLGLSDAEVDAAAAGGGTYSAFVSRLYDRLAEQRRKPLAGEKTPGYVRHIPWLHELFPWARTVHIIRDGRDVALSVLEWATERKGPGRRELWRTQPLATCALWWSWQVRSGREGGFPFTPGRYIEVRYEELVADTEATLRPVIGFLDLPWTPEVLAYHEGRTRRKPGLSAKSAWLPPTAGLRDWRSAMTGPDVELFEALAGDLLSELGYERAHRSVSPAVSELAETCRRQWEDDQARRFPSEVTRPAGNEDGAAVPGRSPN